MAVATTTRRRRRREAMEMAGSRPAAPRRPEQAEAEAEAEVEAPAAPTADLGSPGLLPHYSRYSTPAEFRTGNAIWARPTGLRAYGSAPGQRAGVASPLLARATALFPPPGFVSPAPPSPPAARSSDLQL